MSNNATKCKAKLTTVVTTVCMPFSSAKFGAFHATDGHAQRRAQCTAIGATHSIPYCSPNHPALCAAILQANDSTYKPALPLSNILAFRSTICTAFKPALCIAIVPAFISANKLPKLPAK